MINLNCQNMACSIFSPNDFDCRLDLIKNEIDKSGVILLKNIYSNEIAIKIASYLGIICENIDADQFGITEISNKKMGNNLKNNIAFTSSKLNLHTDRSPLKIPPNLVMNWMCEKNCAGGEAVLVDSYKIFKEIRDNYPEVLKDLCSSDVACFSDGIDSFSGPIFQVNNNRLRVRFRNDRCSYFKLEAKDSVQIFQNIAERYAEVINFDVGSGYIINNYRWMHGRNKFEGYRQIRRIHILGVF